VRVPDLHQVRGRGQGGVERAEQPDGLVELAQRLFRPAGRQGRLRLGLEDPRGTLLYALRRELVEHHVEQPDEVVAAIRAVTPEEVAKVAAATLVPDDADLVVVGPRDPGLSQDPCLATDDWREALAQVPETR